MPATGTTSSAAHTRHWFIAVLLAMVVLAVAAGMALARSKDAAAGPNLGGSTAATSLGTSADSSAGPAESASTPPFAEPSFAQPPAGRPSTAGAEPRREAPKAVSTTKVAKPIVTTPSGPVIVRFRVATEPTCPSGTDQVRYEGQPVVLEWKVTGADATTLAVDGPGQYGKYGTEGSETLNFPCDGEPGSYQSHTYTLKAFGSDSTKNKKLTVKALIHEITTT